MNETVKEERIKAIEIAKILQNKEKKEEQWELEWQQEKKIDREEI